VHVPHDALVVSGGGVKGLASLGALHALAGLGYLRHVRLFAGTSVGSLLCAALATGKTPRQVLAAFAGHVYEPDYDFGGLYASFGLDSGKNLTELIRSVLGRDYTFAEILAEHDKRLVVCASNVSRGRAAYFSPETHPDMDVATAIRMSCSVPLYFAAVRHGGEVFADGGLVDNFPVDWALREGRARRVLGVRLATNAPRIASLVTFIAALVNCTLRDREDPPRDRATILDVDAGDVGALALDLSPEERRALFRAGVRQARVFIKKNA
jgi:predicted acylesterase/phospholipase RssA